MEMDKVKFYCPIIKAKLEINSELLDDMGQFTKFILWAIGEGYNSQEIDDVIELGEHIVQEEILYLNNIGFIIDNDGKYELSESGIIYSNLIKTVATVNSIGIDIQINRCTGEVMRLNNLTFSKENIDENAPIIYGKIFKQLIYNRDYGNSKDYLLKNFAMHFEKLNQVQMDSLYTEIDRNTEDRFVVYELSDLIEADVDYYEKARSTSVVLIKRKIHQISFKVNDERLNPFRTVLNTLSLLKKFDESLISSKALELLRLENEEIYINSTIPVLNVDTFNGVCIDTFINNFSGHQKPIIELPEQSYEIDEKDVLDKLNINNENLIIMESCREFVDVCQYVPLNKFIEKEEL